MIALLRRGIQALAKPKRSAPTVRRINHLILAVLVMLQSLLLAACGGGGTLPSATSSSGSAAVLTQLALTPNTPPTLAIGGTRQFTATGIYGDGTSAALNSGVTWSSSASSVATVSASGLVSAVSNGTATITATDGSKTAAVTVTVAVQAATLSSIAVTPASGSALNIGSTRQLAATGTYSDGGTAILASGLTWTSSATSIATVSSSGLVTAVAAGSTTITAVEAGVSSVPVTVTVAAAPVVLNTLTLSPVSTAALAIAGTQQLTATGHYSDGSAAPVSSGITWASSNTAVATVSGSGLVTGVAAGTATISASVGAVSASPAASVTVTASVTPPANAQVFYGGQYASTVSFLPFGGSVNSVAVDNATTCPGQSYGSLKINFPASGYTGGAMVDSSARNLTAYDAIVFNAKASSALTVALVGLGNNATGVSGFEAERDSIALTTSWQQVILPIPDGSKLNSLTGLFHFADGANHAGAFWLCDVQYASLGTGVLGAPTPAWVTTTASIANGATYQVLATDLHVNWSVGGGPITEQLANTGYFSFASGSGAATVSAGGLVTGTNASGTAAVANISATLNNVTTANALAVTVGAGVTPTPTTLPPTPSIAATSVASLISSVPGGYNGTSGDVSTAVASWKTCWTPPAVVGGTTTPITVGATTFNPRKYVLTNTANYVGIDIGIAGDTCSGATISNAAELNLAGYTRFHVDVWTPDDSANLQFKLVDAGPDGTFTAVPNGYFGIATLTGGSTPPLATGQWLSYDLAIGADFPGNAFPGNNTASLNHFGQIVIVAPAGGTIYVDNMYFH